MLNSVLIIILIIFTLYVSFSLILIVFQNQLIYQPTRKILQTPAHIGMDYENLTLMTSDNEMINAWYIPALNTEVKTTFLLFHGNDGNMSTRLETLTLFKSLGLNTLMIDYRGYGQSQGIATEKNTYEDGQTALNYLINEKHLNYSDIIIFGRSLGGGIATELASRFTVRALILESTYTSIPAAAKDVYRWFPIRYLIQTQYNNLVKLPKIKCPILIIHSEQDDYIPYKHGVQLYETETPFCRKTFLKISGSHGDGFLTSGERYIGGLKLFLESLEPDVSINALT